MEIPTPPSEEFAGWVKEVDRLMKRDWRIDTTDAGLSAGDLARCWQDGDPPDAFVAWLAEKYDLIRYGASPC